MKRQSSTAAAGAALLACVIAFAVLGPTLYGVGPQRLHLEQPLAGPSWEVPGGRDALGRDVLSRTLAGTRLSLLVGVTAVGGALLLGTSLGLAAGFFAGLTDIIVMRAVDLMLAFPGFLFALTLVATLGPSLLHVIVALVATGWTTYARLARAQTMSIRDSDFVHAARSLGASPGRILIRHLLPQLYRPLLAQAVFGVTGAIIAEASLSFLGLGVQPPTASWGAMINEARPFLLVAPHLAIVPGVALSLTILSLVWLAEGARDDS